MCVAIDCQSFSVVQEKWFKQLLNELNPRYNIPSVKYVSQTLIPDLYEQGQHKLRSMLSNTNAQYVVLTTDCCSSINDQGFLTVICHFLSDFINIFWKSFFASESHTLVYLGEQIKKNNRWLAAKWKSTYQLW